VKRIAIINQKGGTGKTTSAINIGAGLHRLGKSVLLVDMDPQANLTYGLGYNPDDLELTVYDILRGEAKPAEVTIDRGGLKVIPASYDLSGAELMLSESRNGIGQLKDSLRSLRGYDYIVIDCPPSLGLLTVSALTAVTDIYIALQVEFFALQGLTQAINTIETVKKQFNPSLEVSGIIPTRFDSRRNLNKDVVESIHKHYRGKIFKTQIRENIALAEAPSYGKTIFEYRLGSHGAEDYQALSREIIKRG